VDLLGGVRPLHDGHADIQDRHVGSLLAGELDGFLPVGCGGHHLVPEGLELAGQREVVQRFIVGDQETQ
jgi:hypothetical protein